MTSDPAGLARRRHAAGVRAAREGAPARAVALISEAAELIEPIDAAIAARMLADAVSPASIYGADRAVEIAQRALALADGSGGATELFARGRLGDALSWAGRYDEASEQWHRAAALRTPHDEEILRERASLLLRAGDLAAAREAAHRALESVRRGSDTAAHLDALALVAMAEIDAGKLREALAAAEEALEAASGRVERLDALGLAAWVEALLGYESECRGHVAEAGPLSERLRITAPGGFAAGLLELSLGDYEAAVGHFAAKVAEIGVPAEKTALRLRRFAASYVEALVRHSRKEEAESLLAGWFDEALQTRQPRFVAPAFRCRGLVSGDPAAFTEALAWHERWSNPFERGRTALCFGETLRRRKRRADARELLRRALADFEHVGARIWRDRARAELVATGETARRRAPEVAGKLTPQELNVASLAATGLTNKEIAARLVLSTKTIETHLRHVFQKLGVRTRTELAARFRDLPDSSGVPLS